MKLAIFTDSFLPGVGGTENAVDAFARAFIKESPENEVLVCAPHYWSKFDDKKFPYKVVRAKSLRFTKSDFWAMPDISPKLKRALDEFKPDVIHCQTAGMMAGYANKYAKKHDIPLIYTIHTNFRYCYLRAFRSKLITELLLKHISKRIKKADCVCSVSHFMANELKEGGIPQDIVVIKNGCDKIETVADKAIHEDKFRLLFVGYIIEFKNIEFSLRALAKVKETRNDFSFKLVGRGPDMKYFQRLAKKLGISENVEFTGVVTDRKELDGHYAESDLFLFPSVIDSDGLVVLEAAKNGTPTLVLKGAAAAERMVDEEDGFIAEPTVDSFAVKILNLMENREKVREVGSKAKEIFTSWKDTTKGYTTLYEQIIKNFKDRDAK